MSGLPEYQYTFSETADYSLPKEQRTDLDGRVYENYIASDRLAEAVNLAIELQRPLLLEGEPGCGKTRLASAIAYQLTKNNLPEGEWWPFYEWVVKSYTRARDGLYTFDAVGRLRDAQMVNVLSSDSSDSIDLEKIRDPKTYRNFGPMGKALQEASKRAVLLIDEVDKADSDFANDLLLELDEFRFEIPETKEKISAPPEPPIVILTSNREKPLPDAFLRRCLYFNIDFPSGEALAEIARQRSQVWKNKNQQLLNTIITEFRKVRKAMEQPGSRPPGTSEFLDLLKALEKVENIEEIFQNLSDRPALLGILLKTNADQELYTKAASKARPGEGRP